DSGLFTFFVLCVWPPRPPLFPYTTLFRSGAGYLAFMFTMAGSRFIADWFTTRFGFRRILQASGLLTCVGLLIAIIFPYPVPATRSEEHTSELQSRENLVCRLLLEKKKKN